MKKLDTTIFLKPTVLLTSSNCLEKEGVEVSENLQNAKILTGYAVETRYPGDYEPVDDERTLEKQSRLQKRF